MQITVPSAIPVLSIGGRVFTDLTSLIVLNAGVNGTNKSNSTFRKGNAVAGYQVTAAKTLTVHAARGIPGTTGIAFVLGYADNDVGSAGNTAFTNLVVFNGSIDGGSMFPGAVGVAVEWCPNFAVPATKYLNLNPNGTPTGLVTAYCYEV